MNLNEGDFYDSQIGMVCLLCENAYTNTETQLYDAIHATKGVHACGKYLHNAITENNFNVIFNSFNPSAECQQQPLICPQCFASAVRLSELDDQLEILQKSLNDFLLTFSLTILHRRTTRINGRQRNGIVELDVNKFPGVFDENDLLNSNEVEDPLLVNIPHSTDVHVKLEDNEPENNMEAEYSISDDRDDFIQLTSQQNEVVTVEYGSENSNETSGDTNISQNQVCCSKQLRINLDRLPFSLQTNSTLIPPLKNETHIPKILTGYSERKSANIHRDHGESTTRLQQNPTKSPEIKKFDCSICGKFFKSVLQRNAHLRIQHPEKSHKCSHCTSVFQYRWHLISHMRIHTEEKPCKCPICQKIFQRNYQLQRHLKIHKGDKQFKCKFCASVFGHRCLLRKHEQTHTEEKIYQCPFCSKAFTTSYNLIVHKRIHTGEKAFKCPSCAKAFSQNSHLKVHMRIHTGERHYKCDVCSKAFLRNEGLTRHKKIHT